MGKVAKQDIFVDTKQLDRLTMELKGFEDKVGEAAYHALNRTLDQVITHVGRIVPKSYAIKAREVKESFGRGIKRPTKSDLTASLTSTGHTLSFAHFPYTPKKPKRGKRSVFQSAVMATIIKSKGKVLSRKGFVATTGAKSKDKTQYNVFKRLGKERLPIAPIRTLSIPQMITNEDISAQIMKMAQEKMDERLQHEIIRAMTTAATKVRR